MLRVKERKRRSVLQSAKADGDLRHDAVGAGGGCLLHLRMDGPTRMHVAREAAFPMRLPWTKMKSLKRARLMLTSSARQEMGERVPKLRMCRNLVQRLSLATCNRTRMIVRTPQLLVILYLFLDFFRPFRPETVSYRV